MIDPDDKNYYMELVSNKNDLVLPIYVLDKETKKL